MMKSKFGIAVSSEVMAILSLATDLKDMRERMGKIVVAYSKTGKPVTTEDLEVAGAMTAWMVEALNPILMQTLEGQPVIVHAGPFANIAIGQSSIIADRIGLKLADYHVTESGFGADIGFEKFWNLKCRYSGLKPDCAVVVATIRALKCHGGAPVPVPGKAMPVEYKTENVEWVAKGCGNLIHHIRNVRKAGISPVVCINAFYTDTDAEIAKVRELCEAEGARVALSRHWEHGGEGAIEFAKTVVEACEDKNDFKFLYDLDMPIKERIELIAKEVYGADGVDFSPAARPNPSKGLQADPKLAKMGICMVKTHLSLSDNPSLKGVPTNWRLHHPRGSHLRRRRLHRAGGRRHQPDAGNQLPIRPSSGWMWMSRPARSRACSNPASGLAARGGTLLLLSARLRRGVASVEGKMITIKPEGERA